jgi:hypothetical protein
MSSQEICYFATTKVKIELGNECEIIHDKRYKIYSTVNPVTEIAHHNWGEQYKFLILYIQKNQNAFLWHFLYLLF